MVKVSIELDGSVDDVIATLRGSIGGLPDAVPSESVTTPEKASEAAAPVQRVGELAAAAQEPSVVRWTETLAADFMARLDPASRAVIALAWRAGDAGIHRSVLHRRTGLTPEELRTLLMRLGHSLRRFQRERGASLSRPVAANSPLQSYFIGPDFAAAASGDMFDGGE